MVFNVVDLSKSPSIPLFLRGKLKDSLFGKEGLGEIRKLKSTVLPMALGTVPVLLGKSLKLAPSGSAC